jgi:hypothetical protein
MNTSTLFSGLCRWTARIVGALLVFFVFFIAIGEGMPIPKPPFTSTDLLFLALILIIVGILVGWRWEFTGGIISLAGFFVGIIPLHNSPRGLTLFYFILSLPGVLYMTSAYLRRYHIKHPSA